ncbi:sensor histidine kinase [Streptomyces sp. NPDC008079]|uniref:sensor histidine kinase n=1 Tax=Streptomyces sp. NPDC008079 TaxID=3364806 RepID=UPI0036EF69BE
MSHEEPTGPPRHGIPFARPVWIPALALAFVQVVGTRVASGHQTGRVGLDWLGYLLLLAGPALLLLRRRAPVVVAAATCGATLLYITLGYPYGPVFASLVVAFFSAVAAGHRRAVPAIALVFLAGHTLIGQWLYRYLPPSGDGRASWAATSAAGAWLLAVLAAAELYRVRREQIARDRRERAEAEHRRADEERMRIARELHDVLAHSISVINVQAGVALALMDERPEQARTALVTIKAASKEALGEVRQVLSTLRAPGEAPRSPAPGLDRLPELVEQAGSAGLKAEVTVDGAPAPLPPGVDLAAFRIVQEALTNIVRHSGSRAARIRLGYRSGSVEVTVDDDGPAVAGGESGGGNGLVGMRERSVALGGTLEAGPRPDGGFRIRALLPIVAPGVPAGGTEAPIGPTPGPSAPADRPEGPIPPAAPPAPRAVRSGTAEPLEGDHRADRPTPADGAAEATEFTKAAEATEERS